MTGFDEIYKTYFNDVFLYIRRLSGGNESIAEEITSETFFKALRAIDSFRGDCDIRVWLCQIAKNCLYNYVKQHSVSLSLDDGGLADIIQSPDNIEQSVSVQSDVMRIHEILHSLKEPYKEVFMLRVFGELSFKKIAQIFDRTENWACVTYHRARKIIQEKTEGCNYEK